MKGLFIVLEGFTGSGKTEIGSRLGLELENAGHKVTMTREPGNGMAEIVPLVLSGRMPPLGKTAQIFLFAADRAEHVQRVIRPALEQGRIVICERYTDALLAYQGYGDNYNLDVLRAINELATGQLYPHFKILLNVSPDLGRERKNKKQRNHLHDLDRRGNGFSERVCEGYVQEFLSSPQDSLICNADVDLESLYQEVRLPVLALVELWGQLFI